MKNSGLDIYTSDGRINPDKAFGLVMEKMKQMTREEFLKMTQSRLR